MKDLLSVLVREGKQRIVLMATMFSVIAIVALALGLVLPKRYDATTLLAVETGSTIKPILEGRAGTTGSVELASITLQVTEGKRILRELLVYGGWVEPPPAKQPDPREEALLIQKLRARMKIEAKDAWVKIAFSDSDPERTYKMANKLAEIYIREAAESQQRESREAFEFIDKQVKEYGEKLGTYHQQVIAHYLRQDTPPKPEAPKPAAPTPRAGQAPSAAVENEIASLRAEKAQLEAQLTRKTSAAVIDTRAEEALRSRTIQLQGELDRLQTTFTDEHPDVKRVRRELAAAQDELRSVEAARRAREADARNSEALDEDVRAAARTRLDAVNKRLTQLTGIAQAPLPSPAAPGRPAPSAAQPDPELKGISQDTTLAELVRRYEATRDVYQDLLKRRETARVSMELIAQHQGFTLRVQEAAEMPAMASSLRVSQFCLVGMLLGVMIPLAVLFGIVRFDPRVRTAQQIELLARVPLLVSIGPSPADTEKARQRNKQRLAMVLVVGVFFVYIATFLLKNRRS